jgi:hypothetical protein
MIGQLRPDREPAKAGESAPRETEVEGRDRNPRERASAGPADTGAVEDDGPRERDGEVDRDSGGDEAPAARLAGEQDRARGERGLEWVAARGERVQRRGSSRERAGDEPRSQCKPATSVRSHPQPGSASRPMARPHGRAILRAR